MEICFFSNNVFGSVIIVLMLSRLNCVFLQVHLKQNLAHLTHIYHTGSSGNEDFVGKIAKVAQSVVFGSGVLRVGPFFLPE